MSNDDQKHSSENEPDNIAAGLVKYRHVRCTIYNACLLCKLMRKDITAAVCFIGKSKKRFYAVTKLLSFNSGRVCPELFFPEKQ